MIHYTLVHKKAILVDEAHARRRDVEKTCVLRLYAMRTVSGLFYHYISIEGHTRAEFDSYRMLRQLESNYKEPCDCARQIRNYTHHLIRGRVSLMFAGEEFYDICLDQFP